MKLHSTQRDLYPLLYAAAKSQHALLRVQLSDLASIVHYTRKGILDGSLDPSAIQDVSLPSLDSESEALVEASDSAVRTANSACCIARRAQERHCDELRSELRVLRKVACSLRSEVQRLIEAYTTVPAT